MHRVIRSREKRARTWHGPVAKLAHARQRLLDAGNRLPVHAARLHAPDERLVFEPDHELIALHVFRNHEIRFGSTANPQAFALPDRVTVQSSMPPDFAPGGIDDRPRLSFHPSRAEKVRIIALHKTDVLAFWLVSNRQA